MNRTSPLTQFGQDPDEVGRLGQRRPGGDVGVRFHLVGDHVGQRRLAQPRRPVEQYMLDRLRPPVGGIDRDLQLADQLRLPDILVETLRPQGVVEVVLLLAGRLAADDPFSRHGELYHEDGEATDGARNLERRRGLNLSVFALHSALCTLRSAFCAPFLRPPPFAAATSPAAARRSPSSRGGRPGRGRATPQRRRGARRGRPARRLHRRPTGPAGRTAWAAPWRRPGGRRRTTWPCRPTRPRSARPSACRSQAGRSGTACPCPRWPTRSRRRSRPAP